jgi:hypothetical protein
MFEQSGDNPQVEEPSKLFEVIREFLRKLDLVIRKEYDCGRSEAVLLTLFQLSVRLC